MKQVNHPNFPIQLVDLLHWQDKPKRIDTWVPTHGDTFTWNICNHNVRYRAGRECSTFCLNHNVLRAWMWSVPDTTTGPTGDPVVMMRSVSSSWMQPSGWYPVRESNPASPVYKTGA